MAAYSLDDLRNGYRWLGQVSIGMLVIAPLTVDRGIFVPLGARL
jgi:hypothetical protein